MPDSFIAHITSLEKQGNKWSYHHYYLRENSLLNALDKVRVVVAEILDDDGVVTSVVIAKVYED